MTPTHDPLPTLVHNGLGELLTSWSFWIYILALLPSLYFVYRYWRYSPWRSTSLGRGLMTLGTSICAVLLNAIVTLIFGPDYQLREVVRLLMLGYVAVAMSYMTKNLVQLQREARRGEDDPSPELADRGPR